MKKIISFLPVFFGIIFFISLCAFVFGGSAKVLTVGALEVLAVVIMGSFAGLAISSTIA